MTMQEILDKLKAGRIFYATAPLDNELWKFYFEDGVVKFDDQKGFTTNYHIDVILEHNLWGGMFSATNKVILSARSKS